MTKTPEQRTHEQIQQSIGALWLQVQQLAAELAAAKEENATLMAELATANEGKKVGPELIASAH